MPTGVLELRSASEDPQIRHRPPTLPSHSPSPHSLVRQSSPTPHYFLSTPLFAPESSHTATLYNEAYVRTRYRRPRWLVSRRRRPCVTSLRLPRRGSDADTFVVCLAQPLPAVSSTPAPRRSTPSARCARTSSSRRATTPASTTTDVSRLWETCPQLCVTDSPRLSGSQMATKTTDLTALLPAALVPLVPLLLLRRTKMPKVTRARVVDGARAEGPETLVRPHRSTVAIGKT